MNKRATRVAAVTAVGAAALVGAGIVAVSASGDTTAAPDTNNVGAITLKVGGNAVTSGSLSDAITAVGESDAALSGSKSVVYGYVHSAYAYGGPTTTADLSAYQPTAEGTWTGAQLTQAVDTSSLTVPLGSSVTLEQFLNAYQPAADGLVELRLKTISPGAAVSAAYDAIDIYVDSAHGTWSTSSTGVTGSPSSGPSTTAPDSPSGTPTTGSPTPTKSATTAPPVVKKVAATVTLKVAKKVKHTKKVPLTVTVKASKAVTGAVTVYDGKKKLASATLSGGKASIKLKKLKKGKHKIKATYAGSATVAAASSKTVTVTSK
ncbi:Ig-like domain repeat protein [Nocardioides sp. BP30]|uniref:Ig-like domain repeat protein n=1 Tax=Nocardioides sp. BP30 TaxID=3036374 RepID=UPI002468F28E|nr:Ig-like domain repeat protein [Nocardioides sp. BP30]WGL51828.1 Ig-like domain repeat protein [Nocardioides sp. BP30]